MDQINYQTDYNSDYSGINELSNVEFALKRYNQHITKKITEAIGIKGQGKILDFGSGQGTIAKLLPQDYLSDLVCVELDPGLLKYLKGLGFDAVSSLNQVNGEIKYIYSSNVLEHIEDDTEVLRSFHNLLSDGGQIILYLPALKICWTQMDLAVGHFRRYSKSELKNKITSSGFQIEKIQDVDFVGVFASIFLRLVGYRQGKGLGNQKSLKFYDLCIFPLSRFFDKLTLGQIMGKNLFVIAKKL